MINIVALEHCDGCGTCVDNCPAGIFEVVEEKILMADVDLCTDCGVCAEVCPNAVLEFVLE